MEIKNLEGLLKPFLKDGQKYQSYTTKYLLPPGENYGSVMLAVEVKLKSGEKDETLHLVAKTCPPTQWVKDLFNTKVTFKKECGLYSSIVPTLQDFQRRRGCTKVIDSFAKYYGSRISLDPEASDVDDDACLLLENLKISGYRNCDRIAGFDLPTIEYLIKDLATFHAVPLALRICEPETFKKNITPYLTEHVEEGTFADDLIEGMSRVIVESVAKDKNCHGLLERLEKALKHTSKNFTNPKDIEAGPFGTITHCDYWVNNTMLKFNDEGAPIANAIVDYQIMVYSNPMRDLVFLLYSSVAPEILTKHYDQLIKLYYNTLIGVLKDLKVDTTPFNYETFLEQIAKAVKDVEIYHTLFMFKPILADKEKVKELHNVGDDDFTSVGDVHESYFTRLAFAVSDFAKKGWL